MEIHTESTALMRIATDECAQLNELSKLNSWDTDYRQLGPGKFYTSFSLYTSTGIRFTDKYCSREMIISGTPPTEHAAFFLPLNPGDKGTLQGKSLGVGDAALIGPGSETFYRSPEGLRMMVATIPLSRLELAQRSATDEEIHQLRAKTHIITLADKTVSRLTRHMNRAQGLGQAIRDQAEINVCLQEIEQDIVTTLGLALTHPGQSEPSARGRGNRLRCLQRARDFIEANLSSPLRLESLSQAAGASVRTLEIAFHEIFNITVVQYIKNRRLIAINRLLRDPQYTATSVATVARAHGFNHMGHFAQDYHALFGECPSDTLRLQAAC